MRSPVLLAVLSLFTPLLAAGEHPWQQLTDPTPAEVAAHFAAPPMPYGVTAWWGWDGHITPEVINRDLDAFAARGIHVVTIEAGYGMSAPYLSPGWFETVRTAVAAAAKRGMGVWLVDEGKYPSGFAGGKFSAERPDLRMQALEVGDKIDVIGGTTLTETLPADTVGVYAINMAGGANRPVAFTGDEFHWVAPPGRWQLLVIEHQFRTSPTRSANNPTRGKDRNNSLEDYLNPAATKQFLAWTEERYEHYVGGELGKTVLGFRGDEPDYSIPGLPWTPALFGEFERRKGYDVRPYVAGFFDPAPPEKETRAKADYWDVWSDLFRDHFFRLQGDWCAAHGVEYLVHLNHEDKMMELVRSEGDFFKDMRYVEVPGIDAIWHQIWPGEVADFPKYASSAAHVFGRPRAFTESFAAYRPAPNLAQARWIMNQQYVRGINLQEVMFVPASSGGRLNFRGWMADEKFPALMAYANRATYLLAQGRPAARIAVYYPTLSLWLGDAHADQATLAIMRQLLEHQRDFDFINEEAFATALTLRDGALENLSGQSYRAVLVPPLAAISRLALDRLQALAAAGGRVIFLGAIPSLVVDRTFRDAAGPPNVDWAVREPSTDLTPAVLAALPPPDVQLDPPGPAVKYLHRRWQGADLYFFFNESDQPQDRTAELKGSGPAQTWDADSGKITDLPAAGGDGAVKVSLRLAPYATEFIVLGNPGPAAGRQTGQAR